jgi:hypothetical protein
LRVRFGLLEQADRIHAKWIPAMRLESCAQQGLKFPPLNCFERTGQGHVETPFFEDVRVAPALEELKLTRI